MSLKNKIIGAIVASALAASPAFAVEGSDGMHYTSASEGFYASIRLRFNSGTTDAANAVIENSSSRLGVQGTGEMSHGLEGFYRYETAFDTVDGSQGFTNTRLAHVGIRGGFGSFRVGSDWADEYNWVVGSTDIANVNSGRFAYNDFYAGRAKQSIFYKSPDFNGLQVAARFQFDGGSDGSSGKASVFPDASDTANLTTDEIVLGLTHDEYASRVSEAIGDPGLDAWALSAKYAFSGFTVAGTYTVNPDYAYNVTAASGDVNDVLGSVEDATAWAVGASYGQDNWGVATWYGETNASDFGAVVDANDETVFSIAGNVSIGKSGVYVVHESLESLTGADNTSTAFGVEYRLNSKSKVWIEYAAQDFDSDQFKFDGANLIPNDDRADDFVTIGLRHDF